MDKFVAELGFEKSGVETELAECIAKAETYEERTAWRTAEIAGLKEALPFFNEDIEWFVILSKQIVKEGEDAHAVYAEFAEWCQESSKNVMFDIKIGKGNVADLQATIEKESATIAIQKFAIQDLAAQIATDEADLRAATEIRTKEAPIFGAEKDLVETIEILERAIGIIEKEMNGGAALAQINKARWMAIS